MKKLLARLLPLHPGEAAPTLLATAYGFVILFAYYLLRPVRDEIGAADRGNLQVLWTAVFLVMLLAVPLYSAAVARLSRAVFIPLTNRFFAANLVLFYLALMWLPETARPWIDRVFYVWVSVFALFVVAVFWGLIVDLFRDEQGERLFGFIAVGASLGGIAGSTTTALLAPVLPVFLLLLIAVLPLEAAGRLGRALDRRAEQAPATLRRAPSAPIGGSAWSGIGPVFRSPALRRIALWILLMTFASTILYFVQSHLIGEVIADRAARRVFLARIDLAVNVVTIATQILLTARILARLGFGATLAVLPAVAALGFVVLGNAGGGALAALLAVRVLYDSSRHALAKPAREVLFTRLTREQRYKSKAFIDAAVYRGGDLVSGWIYAGFGALGLGAAAIALIAAPVAVLWGLLGWQMGKADAGGRGGIDE
ncbi:MAG: MFS transporter [Betaproteobacteria bacterium]|nr:MFS transporter [Betaproteobacteria bacterium]